MADIFNSSISYTSCHSSLLAYRIDSSFTLPVTSIYSFAELPLGLSLQILVMATASHILCLNQKQFGFSTSHFYVLPNQLIIIIIIIILHFECAGVGVWAFGENRWVRTLAEETGLAVSGVAFPERGHAFPPRPPPAELGLRDRGG